MRIALTLPTATVTLVARTPGMERANRRHTLPMDGRPYVSPSAARCLPGDRNCTTGRRSELCE